MTVPLVLTPTCTQCSAVFQGTEKFCTTCGTRRLTLNVPHTVTMRSENPLSGATRAGAGAVIMAILIDLSATVIFFAGALVCAIFFENILLGLLLALIGCVFLGVQGTRFASHGQTLGWTILGIRCVTRSTGAPIGQRWDLLGQVSAATIRRGRDPLAPFLAPAQSIAAFAAASQLLDQPVLARPVVPQRTGSTVPPPAMNPVITPDLSVPVQTPAAEFGAAPVLGVTDLSMPEGSDRMVPHYPGSPHADAVVVPPATHAHPAPAEQPATVQPVAVQPETLQPATVAPMSAEQPPVEPPSAPPLADGSGHRADERFEESVLQPLSFEESQRPAVGSVWLQIDGIHHALSERTVIGRNPVPADGEAAIAVNDFSRTMSKKHLLIEHHDDGSIFVTDLGSTNGSTLRTDDGAIVSLTAHVRMPVSIGESILVEDHTIQVDTKASAARRERGGV